MFNQLDAYSFPCNEPLLKDSTSNNNVKQLEGTTSLIFVFFNNPEYVKQDNLVIIWLSLFSDHSAC